MSRSAGDDRPESSGDAPFPIVDAAPAFWDVGLNDYPWLSTAQPIPFRYGDYRALPRSYLPGDYRRDNAGHRVVKTVHVEAEWTPADPVGETRWLEGVASPPPGLPTAVVAQAWLDRADAAEVLADQAAHPMVRGIRHKPKAGPSPGRGARRSPGSMGDPDVAARATPCSRYGLSFDLQTP